MRSSGPARRSSTRWPASALGPSVLGTIVTTRFPRNLAHQLDVHGVAAPAAYQVVEGATRGASISAVPTALRAAVADSVARAFTGATHLGLVVGGIVLLVMAIPTVAFVRHRQVRS